ncbi:Rpn family recombination-promoting nuclease/putative transposase [Treponema sp. R80B11-R83G3]
MKNQNPTQYEWGPFPFEGGTQVFDIRHDPVFKTVFTRDTANSRAALSDLISALIGSVIKVETITANEPPVSDLRQRYLRFDIACKTKKGEPINVEMSFNPKANEHVRLEYHAARLFAGQELHGKGKNYIDLKKTYQIAILAKKKFFPDKDLIHDFIYYDPKTRISLGGKTRIITVELEKTKPIVEKPIEKMTTAELWAVFFEYLTDPEKRAKIVDIINKEEGIAMAVKTMKGFTQRELDYIRESYRIKCDMDYQDEVVTAQREVLKVGRRERKKGREEEKLIIAKNLLVKGSTPEFVHDITGLSLEKIKELNC